MIIAYNYIYAAYIYICNIHMERVYDITFTRIPWKAQHAALVSMSSLLSNTAMARVRFKSYSTVPLNVHVSIDLL